MNNLPKIFKNKIDIDNNTKYYRIKETDVKEEKKEEQKENFKEVLDSIFKNNYMPYSKEVKIYLTDKEITTRLVKRYSNYLLTIDNAKIKIDEIKKIEIL